MSTAHPTAQPTAEYVSAERLGLMFDPPLSIATIRRFQTRRVIPFVRLGRRVLFSPAAVRRALESRHTVRARGEDAAA